MITKLKQGDPRWGNIRIGESATTLKRDGCTITALCMLLEKFRGYPASPKDAAFYWAFNYRGEILWEKTKFRGMVFLYRYYNNNIKEIAIHANDPSSGVIVQVNRNHWLYIDKVDGKKLSGVDPLTGKGFDELPSQYSITGFATFEKDMEFVSEWAKENWDRAKDEGLPIHDPKEEIDIMKFQILAKAAGLDIKNDKQKMTAERAIELLYRWKEDIERYKNT